MMPVTTTWLMVCQLEDIPVRGARVIRTESGCIALFRTAERRSVRARRTNVRTRAVR